VSARLRWATLAVFVLSSALNYLDRQTLTTLAPVLRDEFHLSHAEYGWILAAFSLAYAAAAPFAGMFIDRAGLNRAVSLAVGLWSGAGIATGLTTGLGGLVGCRAVLGVAEAAGIPAAGKAIHHYLKPAERALGNALNQAGVSLGSMAALPLAAWLAGTAGWRSAFLITGSLGLLWIPLWNWTARCADAPVAAQPPSAVGSGILFDRRLWAFVASNALGMVGY
jgi:MFS transporter, ACS family, hexuronate transporter